MIKTMKQWAKPATMIKSPWTSIIICNRQEDTFHFCPVANVTSFAIVSSLSFGHFLVIFSHSAFLPIFITILGHSTINHLFLVLLSCFHGQVDVPQMGRLLVACLWQGDWSHRWKDLEFGRLTAIRLGRFLQWCLQNCVLRFVLFHACKTTTPISLLTSKCLV